MRMIWVTQLMLIATVGGCAVNPPWPNPQQLAEQAAGVEGAIELRLEGEPIDAQAAHDGQLSMAEAIRQSLHHDPGVQIALARVRAALAEAHQARLLPNPVVSVVLRWSESGGSPTVEAGIAADLLSLLRRPGEIDAADQRLGAASTQVVTAVLDVLAQTQNRFVQIQALDDLLPVLDERGKLLDRLVTLARQRLEGGEGTRLDMTTLQAQRVDLDIEIAERQIEQRTARLALARLIGQPSADAAWTLDRWLLPEQPIGDESPWIRAALAHRPEIQAKVWEIQALGADLRLTRWALFEPIEGGIESERDAGEWSLGPAATVPLPLFDWGQAKREAAQAALLESLHGLTATRRQVVEDVRSAHLSHTRLFEAYRTARDRLIPLLQQRLGEAESAFRAGQSDVTPLILAEQDLQAGRTRLIDLERRAAESLVALYRAVGGPGRLPDAATVPTATPIPHTPRKEQP
ncbi:MAG: TolC family protein [Phycisphaeraceae bacterium]